MAKQRYKFLYACEDVSGKKRYVWEGPPVDSRVIQVSCGADWFWGLTKEKPTQ